MISSMIRKCFTSRSSSCRARSAACRQRPVLQLESGLSILYFLRTETTHKVLIGIGRVELNEGYTILRPREMLGEFLSYVSLPGTRRSLEDDLLLVVEELVNVVKEGDGEVEFVCEVV